jgi:hypothetical protein
MEFFVCCPHRPAAAAAAGPKMLNLAIFISVT